MKTGAGGPNDDAITLPAVNPAGYDGGAALGAVHSATQWRNLPAAVQAKSHYIIGRASAENAGKIRKYHGQLDIIAHRRKRNRIGGKQGLNFINISAAAGDAESQVVRGYGRSRVPRQAAHGLITGGIDRWFGRRRQAYRAASGEIVQEEVGLGIRGQRRSSREQGNDKAE